MTYDKKINKMSYIKITPPPLPSDLPDNITTILIQSLNDKQKQLFYKVMRLEVDKLLPITALDQFNSLISLYWMVEVIRKRYNVRSASLALLGLIYYASGQGRNPLRIAALLPFSPDSLSFIYNTSMLLLKEKYITRVNKYGKPQNFGRFIIISPEGIKLLKTMRQELRDLVYSTHINIEKPPKH